MAGRLLLPLLLATWIPSTPHLLGCGGEGERTGTRSRPAPAAEFARPGEDPFAGSYRVRGLTTDVARGDSRRIQGIVVITAREGSYSTNVDLETKYPSQGGPVDAHVIGSGTAERSRDVLRGTSEEQLVMSTVPGVDTGFAWVPRTVGPRLVSTWEAHFRHDGTLVVEIQNDPAKGVEYSPTTTTLYGIRIEEAEGDG